MLQDKIVVVKSCRLRYVVDVLYWRNLLDGFEFKSLEIPENISERFEVKFTFIKLYNYRNAYTISIEIKGYTPYTIENNPKWSTDDFLPACVGSLDYRRGSVFLIEEDKDIDRIVDQCTMAYETWCEGELYKVPTNVVNRILEFVKHNMNRNGKVLEW